MNPDFDKCDPASIPSGLHVWTGEKWQGIKTPKHYDDINPELASPLSLPNSYIVTPGSSMTFPITKAIAAWKHWASPAGGNKLNGLTHPPTPFEGNLSVQVVWEEGFGERTEADKPIISGTPTLDGQEEMPILQYKLQGT